MNILFTVCGRAGSKRFKNKNLQCFLGFPLIYYTLAAVEGYVETCDLQTQVDVCVNSDSAALLALAEEQKRVPVHLITRASVLSGDTVPKMEVIQDCLLQMEERTTCTYDMVVDLDLTSPLRTIQNICNAIGEKQAHRDADVIFSVVPARRNPYFNMVVNDGAYYHCVLPSVFTACQQAPTIYDMNGSIYAYEPRFLKTKPLSLILEGKCGIIPMRDTAVLDIDSEEDFILMEAMAMHLLPIWDGYREIFELTKQFGN